MAKLPVLKARKLVRVLKGFGFVKRHQVGSHAQFRHRDGRRTTVPIHPGKDIGRKTLKGIIDDLEISVEEFMEMLRK